MEQMLESFLKIYDTTDGRDKLWKLVQYSSRGFSWMLEDTRLKHLYKGLSLSRKGFRLGKWLKELNKLLKDTAKQVVEVTVEHQLLVFARMTMIVYLIFDNLIFLAKSKIVKFDAAALKLRGHKFRFLATLAHIYLQWKARFVIRAKIEAESCGCTGRESKLAALQRKEAANTLKLTKYGADLFVAFANSGFSQMFLGLTANDGLIGAAGSLSALAVLQDVRLKVVK